MAGRCFFFVINDVGKCSALVSIVSVNLYKSSSRLNRNYLLAQRETYRAQLVRYFVRRTPLFGSSFPSAPFWFFFFFLFRDAPLSRWKTAFASVCFISEMLQIIRISATGLPRFSFFVKFHYSHIEL